MADTAWVWFGNIPVVNSVLTTQPTAQQTATLQGAISSAQGQYDPDSNPNGMQAVDVTGTTPNSSTFDHTYQTQERGFFNRLLPRTPSQFTYTSPTGTVQGATMTSVYSVDLKMTNQAGDEYNSVGFVMQMSNGDLFFRPSNAALNSGDLNNYTLTGMSFANAVPLTANERLLTAAFRPTVADVAMICFTSGTLIRTALGDKRIEDLRVGDTVTTADHGEQAVRWIRSRTLNGADLQAYPQLRPVRISAGALGGGLPVADLLVSPQHRVLVRSKIAATMFGAGEVLVAAKHLTDLPGIAVAGDVTAVTYWHFLCDAHQIVYANDAAAETLYTGAVALMSVGAQAREEIFAIFPALRDAGAGPSGVRLLLTGRQGRKLAERHRKNARTLVAAA